MVVWLISQLKRLPLFSSLIHCLDKKGTWDFFLMQYPFYLLLQLLSPLYLSKYSYIYPDNTGKIFIFPVSHLGEKEAQKDEMRFSEESKFRFWFARHSQSLSHFERSLLPFRNWRTCFQLCPAHPGSHRGTDFEKLPKKAGVSSKPVPGWFTQGHQHSQESNFDLFQGSSETLTIDLPCFPLLLLAFMWVFYKVILKPACFQQPFNTTKTNHVCRRKGL